MVGHRRTILTILSVIVIVSAGGCNTKRRSFLSRIDPNALLTACREVMAEAAVGTFKLGRYEFRGPPVSPDVSRFPQRIRVLVAHASLSTRKGM